MELQLSTMFLFNVIDDNLIYDKDIDSKVFDWFYGKIGQLGCHNYLIFFKV